MSAQSGTVHLAEGLKKPSKCLYKKDMATKPIKKNPAAVALGRLGGLKGGKARAKKLTPEQRSEISRQGAIKRWGPPKK